jgi:UDP-N-acetylmuramoylalanine--D-glutamate ligase
VSHVDWQGKTVLVLGLGLTGISSLRWLARRGATLRVADSRDSPPFLAEVQKDHPGLEVHLGAFREESLAGVDTVVASPGIALREPILRAAVAKGIEVLGDIEIFAREINQVKDKGIQVLGVTGTNGKSTVTMMADAMAKASSRRSVGLGNVGMPVLDVLADAEDNGHPQVYVLELSSYQLETTTSLALDAAVVLNVSQDHLDRYDSMAGYAAAKQRIFRDCRTRVVNRDDPMTLAMARGAKDVFTIGFGEPAGEREWGFDKARQRLRRGNTDLIAVGEIAVPGLHNALNALAAHALGTAIGLPNRAMATALRQFKGLPHRVELVAEANGVRFYDDSKGTNVGATVAALEGFRDPVVLIAGGDGKGQDFAPLAPAVKARARGVVLIGKDAAAIDRALAGTGVPVKHAASMEAAVQSAFAMARPGDAVVLSPACASLDMFRNYGHRGDVFTAAVRGYARGKPQ